ncbi:MAG: endonuclease V [bacterium]|nr:MAG: endonuclease V [bacterium]
MHSWDLSSREAAALQGVLAARIRGGSLPRVRTVLGCDVSYCRSSGSFRASVVLLSFPTMEPVGSWTRKGETAFPYVPGLLSFREIPPLLPLLEKVPAPDLIIVDGHGIAHPRGVGLASHIGLITGLPTIGCAKRRLIGEYTDPSAEAGAREPLTVSGHPAGFVLRSKRSCRPIFVSPGHLLDPEEALRGTVMCLRGYRLPEPTRLADRLTRGLPVK